MAVSDIFQQDMTHALQPKQPLGLSQKTLAELLEKAKKGQEQIRQAYADKSMPLYQLAGRREDLPELKAVAEEFRHRFTDVVVLGAGGSSLGAQAVCALKSSAVTGPRLHFPENLDPDLYGEMIAGLDFTRTGYLVVTKSGNTTETLAQVFAIQEPLRRQCPDWRSRIVGIVSPGDNPLRRLAGEWNFRVMDHDPKLGGRFSVLSLVGVLPMLISGLDAVALREGAQEVFDDLIEAEDLALSPPAVGAAWLVGLQEQGSAGQHVLFPYLGRLERFTAWYRQLWAESLGKSGKGITPETALGPVDQHSQLQLYLDGPADKAYTIVKARRQGTGPLVPGVLVTDDRLAYLRDRHIGDIVQAQSRATTEVLVNNGRPIRLIRFEKLNEKVLGALMMHFMLETVLAANILELDPFDQPAVEHGKILTQRYLASFMM